MCHIVIISLDRCLYECPMKNVSFWQKVWRLWEKSINYANCVRYLWYWRQEIRTNNTDWLKPFCYLHALSCCGGVSGFVLLLLFQQSPCFPPQNLCKCNKWFKKNVCSEIIVQHQCIGGTHIAQTLYYYYYNVIEVPTEDQGCSSDAKHLL